MRCSCLMMNSAVVKSPNQQNKDIHKSRMAVLSALFEPQVACLCVCVCLSSPSSFFSPVKTQDHMSAFYSFSILAVYQQLTGLVKRSAAGEIT